MRQTVLVIISLMLLGLGVMVTRAQSTPCDETRGQTERVTYRSSQLDRSMVYTVYTPPCYDSSEAVYPLLVLLHGSNDDDNHWLRLGLAEVLDAKIAAGEIAPMVVVLPFGDWIANENRFGPGSWGDVLLSETIPHAENHYRTDPTRHAIGGISRGGFWAFNAAFRAPERFRAVGGHSPFFIENLNPAEQDPVKLAASLQQPPAIYLDRGLDDYAAPNVDLMHSALDAARIAHTYRIRPGEHINAYWAEHLPEYIDFYAAALSQTEPAQRPLVFATNTPRPPAVVTGTRLYVPVVFFPSRRINLPSIQLDAVLAGELDPQLTVPADVAEALAGYGFSLHPQTRILPPEAVYNDLARDRRRYAILPWDALTPRIRVLWVDELHPVDHVANDSINYPLAFDSESPNFDPDGLTRIVVTGVTAMARQTVPALDQMGVEAAASGIAPYLRRADFVHTSNEVSFVEGCPQVSDELPRLGGNSSFCSKRAHFDLLEQLGVNIVELSGNHNNDFGYDAYLDTLAWYRERGMLTVGGGANEDEARQPLIIEHNGSRIAWLSCNWVGPYYALANDDPALTGGVRPGAAPCDLNWLRETLPQLSVDSDLLIVTVQYFEYDQHPPTDEQRRDFALLADLGADVVIGTQAHFPQTYAFVPGMGSRESFVHYGVGNFIFDQPFWATTRFVLDQLFIYEGRLVAVDIMPGIIDSLARPRPMTPEERENFLFVLFDQHGGW